MAASSKAPTTTFRAVLARTGTNTTGIEVPDAALAALGGGKRAAVAVTLDGRYSYRTTLGSMRGQTMISVSAEHRSASGLSADDEVEVRVSLDDAPRPIEVPEDLLSALRADPEALGRFEALAPSYRKAHVTAVTSAKAEATRARRIAGLVESLRS